MTRICRDWIAAKNATRKRLIDEFGKLDELMSNLEKINKTSYLCQLIEETGVISRNGDNSRNYEFLCEFGEIKPVDHTIYKDRLARKNAMAE